MILEDIILTKFEQYLIKNIFRKFENQLTSTNILET